MARGFVSCLPSPVMAAVLEWLTVVALAFLCVLLLPLHVGWLRLWSVRFSRLIFCPFSARSRSLGMLDRAKAFAPRVSFVFGLCRFACFAPLRACHGGDGKTDHARSRPVFACLYLLIAVMYGGGGGLQWYTPSLFCAYTHTRDVTSPYPIKEIE